ncbi:MAG: UbiA family prenyltransferase [Deltaproteobacteria bacterium]
MSGDESKRPLCVDLDGTLIATDALWESFLLLIKAKPYAVPAVPLWLLGGKANLKQRLADRVLPDAAALPYREPVLERVRQAKSEGRQVLLVTASEQRIADRVGTHLELFDEVVGSNGDLNLKGSNKAKFLTERFGEGAFDYIGDTDADFPLWKASGRAFVANASSSMLAKAKAQVGEVEAVGTRSGSKVKAIVKALRPHQWMKNVLLFVAPLLGHIRDIETWVHVLIAFFAFSFTASSVYVLNDLLDLDSDRQHRTKKNRPFASGALSIPFGLLMFPLAMGSGIGLSLVFLPLKFTGALLGYLVLTTAYSVWLKRKLMVDVLMLASLFTYRVLSGGVAADVTVSFWLLGFSMFFFLGLAFVKRFSELVATMEKDVDKVPGRGYWVSDIDIIRSVGPSSGLMAVLVFCLYMNSPEVQSLYAQPTALWGIAPILLYWIMRVWFLASRNQLHDDPVLFAVRDKISIFAGFLAVGCLVAAAIPWPF